MPSIIFSRPFVVKWRVKIGHSRSTTTRIGEISNSNQVIIIHIITVAIIVAIIAITVVTVGVITVVVAEVATEVVMKVEEEGILEARIDLITIEVEGDEEVGEEDGVIRPKLPLTLNVLYLC